jgi:site-specific DNA recombinase
LQKLGIKPRRSKRGVWSTSTLSHLLRNKTYIGEAHYGKSYAIVPEHPFSNEKYRKNKKTSRRDRPEDEWIKIPVPAVLDRDLFMRVQKQLDENFELSKRNRKNEYLLAGKTWCLCGSRRTGEGPHKGKHLYYRCTNKVRTFPLPRTCYEKGVNARIADKMVWQRVAGLMSSPELLIKQIGRWSKQRHDKRQGVGISVEELKKDILKLKDQEDRYNKAYGVGLITIEKLKEYVVPLRERIAAIETQFAEAAIEQGCISEARLPEACEVVAFATKASKTLHRLNFEAKRAIVMDVIEKIVGSQQELVVSGNIPVNNHVELQTIHRYSGPTECGEVHAFQTAYEAGHFDSELSVCDDRSECGGGAGAGRAVGKTEHAF